MHRPTPNASAPRRGPAPARRAAAVAAAFLALVVGGCSGHRDVLDPASIEAGRISSLWWLFCIVCTAVFAIVLVFLVGAMWRARRSKPPLPAGAPEVLPSTAPGERRLVVVVGSATAVTAIILFVLLVLDFSTGHALRPTSDPQPLTVKITGHQWWWEIEYDDPQASNTIVTGNELHLPVGRPVQLLLQSNDVIHSFWIPNLQGKKDLVPGHPTSLWLQPDRIGTYHGQCAEFCGLQHAHMDLLAVVESPQKFTQWQVAQRRPAPEPTTASQKRGRDVFLTTSCVLCHTIQGTLAGSRVGPPLTHIASQAMIGANSFPNRRGYLAGWIVDPQSMKPGAHMPQNLLSADDLNALLDYLESLK